MYCIYCICEKIFSSKKEYFCVLNTCIWLVLRFIMLELILINAKDRAKIEKLCKLKLEIWKDFYHKFYDKKLLNYICFFVNPQTIKGEILNNFNYAFIAQDEDILGYLSYYFENDVLNFSEIYLEKSHTKQKIGFQAFEKIKEIALKNNVSKIQTYVEEENLNAQNAFLKWGFKKEALKARCIGNDYYFLVFEFVYEI